MHGCGYKTGCGMARYRCGAGCSCSKHVTCVNREESTKANVLIDKIS